MRSLKCFSSLRGNNSETTHYLLTVIFFFQLNTLKDTAKALPMDCLRLNTLRGTKPAFLNPKKYEENPPPFLNGSPPLRRVLPLEK